VLFRSAGVERLRNELGRERQHRLELTARDPARCVEAIGNVLEKKGLALLTESPAGEALRKKAKVSYLIYVEALTADDWAEIVRQAATQAPGLDAVVLAASVTDGDRAELKTVFGVDPVGTVPTNNHPPGVRSAVALTALYPPKAGTPSTEAGLFIDRRRDTRPGVKMCVIIRPGGLS